MSVTETSKRMHKPAKENGGWGDLRDHELCLNNSVVALSESVNFLPGSSADSSDANFSRPLFYPL